jgi:hypothetical protein
MGQYLTVSCNLSPALIVSKLSEEILKKPMPLGVNETLRQHVKEIGNKRPNNDGMYRYNSEDKQWTLEIVSNGNSLNSGDVKYKYKGEKLTSLDLYRLLRHVLYIAEVAYGMRSIKTHTPISIEVLLPKKLKIIMVDENCRPSFSSEDNSEAVELSHNIILATDLEVQAKALMKEVLKKRLIRNSDEAVSCFLGNVLKLLQQEI